MYLHHDSSHTKTNLKLPLCFSLSITTFGNKLSTIDLSALTFLQLWVVGCGFSFWIFLKLLLQFCFCNSISHRFLADSFLTIDLRSNVDFILSLWILYLPYTFISWNYSRVLDLLHLWSHPLICYLKQKFT